jgi:RNA polymerase sigma factor (TIGR02999 family)
MTDNGDITGLLADWQQGDAQALERLSPLVYQELRRVAQRYMASESSGHTLQPTALVNEAFLRLVDGDVDYQSRKHFYVIAARMMRRVLVDHARGKNRQKRGDGIAPVTLLEDQHSEGGNADPLPILKLNEALTKLTETDPKLAEAVELVYFGGLPIDEAAVLLSVSRSKLYDDLRFAKAWLVTEIA